MNMGSHFLPGAKENLCGFSFPKQGLAHRRSGSESIKFNQKSESCRFLTLLSPRDSCSQDTGLLSTRTHSESSSQVNKYVSIIAKLNEEIQILSAQLKESNEIISHFTLKLNEISVNFIALKEITEKFKLKNEELEKKIFSLTSKNKDLKKTKEAYEKKFKSSQSDHFPYTMQQNPEQISHYNEIIIKLNEQFLLGIDEVLGKLKKNNENVKSDELEENIKEFQGFFSNEFKSILSEALKIR